MKTILIPTDFSEYSDFALTSVIPLARMNGSRVVLFHVLEKGEEPLKTKERLRELGEEDLNGIEHEYQLSSGDPIKAITSQKADLIVMGSKGAHGFTSFFKGTNAEKVAKSATCPVITLKEYQDLSRINQIIYPTDLRNEQEAILEDIKDLQKQYLAQLKIMKVFDSTLVTKDEVEKRLKGYAEFHGFTNFSVIARDNINEGDEILHYAEEINADLIAMGTHDRHGLAKLVGGYISGNVIKHAQTAIWTKVIHPHHH